jgi:hypothetical protein
MISRIRRVAPGAGPGGRRAGGAGGLSQRVPAAVVRAFDRLLNIHPALLPGTGRACATTGPRGRARGSVTRSGATVHLVTEEYDRGPILGQATVPVLPGDTPDTLAPGARGRAPTPPAAVLAAAPASKAVTFRLEAEMPNREFLALTPSP